MPMDRYEPEFKSPGEVRELLIEAGLFEDGDLSRRAVLLALEVLHSRHQVGKAKDGYEITSDHLPVITQYIDRETVLPVAVDIS